MTHFSPLAVSEAIFQNGYCLLPSALDAEQIQSLRQQCENVLTADAETEHARSSRGHVYAARNLIDLLPAAKTVWRSGILFDALLEVLGYDFGLVRALFFDKPPERTWALPWHKDETIAVAEHRGDSLHFSRPTLKAGVPHVIASDAILQRMLTLRIHLDDVDDENGPLRVIPQSHLSKQARGVGPENAVTIHANAGDALAMRPLIDHSSGASIPGTTRHRRILHLEFAADASLPDGYRWFHFLSARDK